MTSSLPSTHLHRQLPSAHLQPLPASLVEPPVSEVPLREYFRILTKYRMVIAAVMVVVTILALLYAFTLTPLYSAKSTVRISTYEPVLMATRIEDLLQEKSKETNYLETQIQEMKSYSLANKVLLNSNIRDFLRKPASASFFSGLFGRTTQPAPEYAADKISGYQFPIEELTRYLRMVDVRSVRRTALVEIFAVTSSPEFSAMIANRHAQAYIDWIREVRVEQQSRGLTFLRSQAEELRERVADLEREMADYAETNSIVAVNKDENITVQKMSQLNKLLTDAIAKRIEAQNLYKEAEAALANPSAGFDDSSTQAMRAELAKLEGEYQQLSTKFTSSYPRMQQLHAQIDGLKDSLQNQRKQIVMGLKAKMAAAEQEEKNFREELEQQKSQAYDLSKRQVQYNVLNRELTTSRDLLQNVLKQIKETSLSVESNASNVSIVDHAITPSAPSFPNKKLLVLVGLFVGLGSGIAIAFLLDYLDNSLRTPEDVAAVLKLPSLGVVPSFGLEEPAGRERARIGNNSGRPRGVPAGSDLIARGDGAALPPIAYEHDPRSLASEAYRTIRTGILLSQAGEPPKTILVSSAQSSEGKTTSSINLAACLASAGGKVVLLDADLRRPSLHKHLKLDSNEPGLVEILTGQASFEDVAISDVIRRVTVLRSGKIPPNPAELVGSLEMATLLDQLSEKFDYVLIDSPPVLPVTDSVILSRYVDGVVLVVRGSATPRKVVVDAKTRLQAIGARMLGVVLNDVDISGGDYYYYRRYYHSYYDQDLSRSAPS